MLAIIILFYYNNFNSVHLSQYNCFWHSQNVDSVHVDVAFSVRQKFCHSSKWVLRKTCNGKQTTGLEDLCRTFEIQRNRAKVVVDGSFFEGVLFHRYYRYFSKQPFGCFVITVRAKQPTFPSLSFMLMSGWLTQIHPVIKTNIVIITTEIIQHHYISCPADRQSCR